MNAAVRVYHQLSREIGVAGCCLASAVTLGYIMVDTHNLELKQQKRDYESKINKLYDEIKMLKYEREVNKLK